jgi:iron complex transport system substrate-binding protein
VDLGAIEETAALVKDIAYRIHRVVGPGYRESVYHTFLHDALRRAGATPVSRVRFGVSFEGLTIPSAGEVDLMVNGHLVVEVKATELFHPLHRHQVLTYLKAAQLPLGILANFGMMRMKDGFHRIEAQSEWARDE